MKRNEIGECKMKEPVVLTALGTAPLNSQYLYSWELRCSVCCLLFGVMLASENLLLAAGLE